MEWKALLSPKRQRSASGKRSETDNRTEFQKDYHRIVGSASFRRLQDKTQVFPLERGDFVRTRLTHSLEVSSFAASLGQSVGTGILERRLDSAFTERDAGAMVDVLRAAGLVHDIGNPPFGHFGEDAIRMWFSSHADSLLYRGERISSVLSKRQMGDLIHFEGNAQALRILSKLHCLVGTTGMNLTYALLSTVVKYPVPSTGIDKRSGNVKDKKMGYMQSEEELYRDLAKETGTNGARHPLTFLLEEADDIAYLTGDIEDAVKKGKISYETLLFELQSACAGNAELSKIAEKLVSCKERAIGSGMPDPSLNAVQNWVVFVQSYLLGQATNRFLDCYKEIMEGSFATELLSGTPAGALCKQLGAIAYRYVFRSKEILKIEISAYSIFEFLLSKFVPAAIHYGERDVLEDKLMCILSENYKYVYARESEGKSEADKLYLRLLLVTDYLCGMTDSYAKNLYQELSGIAKL